VLNHSGTRASLVLIWHLCRRAFGFGRLDRFLGNSGIARSHPRTHTPVVNDRGTQEQVLDGSALPAENNPRDAQREGNVEGRTQQRRHQIRIPASAGYDPHQMIVTAIWADQVNRVGLTLGLPWTTDRPSDGWRSTRCGAGSILIGSGAWVVDRRGSLCHQLDGRMSATAGG